MQTFYKFILISFMFTWNTMFCLLYSVLKTLFCGFEIYDDTCIHYRNPTVGIHVGAMHRNDNTNAISAATVYFFPKVLGAFSFFCEHHLQTHRT